jgi:hypothetical protein
LAYEKFEAARLNFIAVNDHATVVSDEVESELGPEPHRTWASDEPRHKIAAANWWHAQRRRRVEARLGTDEDEFWKTSFDRMECAQEALAEIQATTLDGLLCQIRAWWINYMDPGDTEIPIPDKGDSEIEETLKRFYHDLERLAGEARP